MSFYRLQAKYGRERCVVPGQEIQSMARGCSYSEFQYLDHSPMECQVLEEGGVEYPDYLPQGNIPLVSSRFRQVLEAQQVDNLFYKPVLLIEAATGERTQYYLALPPAIACLDEEASILEGLPEPGSSLPDLARVKAVRPVILAANVGNYRIFRIAGIVDSGIYITEELKSAIEAKGLSNICFSKVEE